MDHARATDVLGSIVAVITAEQGRQGRGSGNSSMTTIQQMYAVKCKIYGPTRMAGQSTESVKAADALGAMVAAVPVVRATDLGALCDPRQSR